MFGIEEILIESNAVSINKNKTRANKIFYCSKFLQCRLIFLPKKSPEIALKRSVSINRKMEIVENK